MKFRLAFALLIGLVVSLPAAATILFAGSEDIDFTISASGGSDVVGTTVNVRAGWARGGLAIGNALTTNNPPDGRITTPAFANATILWTHAQVLYTIAGTTSGSQIVGWFGSDGVRRLLIRGSDTASTVKLSTRTSGGTITDLMTCSASWPLANTLSKMDVFINYAVAGRMTVYINDAIVCDYNGDITTDGITSLSQTDFASFSTGVSNIAYWSEVIISTSDTRAMGLRTLIPVAAGNTQAWTPNTVGNINPNVINDSNFISSSSASQISEWTVGSLPAGNFAVIAVKQSARMLRGSSGPQTFDFVFRPGTGSTDYNACLTSPTTLFADYYCYWTANPATSTAIVPADLGAGTNFGVESQP